MANARVKIQDENINLIFVNKYEYLILTLITISVSHGASSALG